VLEDCGKISMYFSISGTPHLIFQDNTSMTSFPVVSIDCVSETDVFIAEGGGEIKKPAKRFCLAG